MSTITVTTATYLSAEKECTLADINNNLTGSRVNNLGFYDSCISNTTQNYYLLTKYPKEFSFEDLDESDPVDLYSGTAFNIFGVCATAACSNTSIAALYDSIFDQIPEKARKLGPVNVTDVPDFLKNSQKIDFSVIAFWSVLAVIAWFVILSTLVNFKLRRRFFRLYQEKFEKVADTEEIMLKVSDKIKTLPWRHFDLQQNFKKVISPPKFKDPVSQTFTVARAFAMLLVILGHELTARLQLSDLYTADPTGFIEYMKSSAGVGLAQMGFYSVSMFFFIGGFVSIIASEGFFAKAKNVGRNCCSCYLYMILRRYMRLAPILFLVELYTARVLRHISNSPSSVLFGKQSRESCSTSAVLAELSLLVPTRGCAAWVWYIQCDFNMFMVLMVVVLLTKTAKARTVFMSILIALSFISSGVAMYLAYSYFGILNNDFVYILAFYRLRIYLAGAIMGYFLSRRMEMKKKEREELERREARMTHQEKWTKLREWLATSDDAEDADIEVKETVEDEAEGNDIDGDRERSSSSRKKKTTKNLFIAKNYVLTDEGTAERNLEALSKPLTTDILSTSKNHNRRRRSTSKTSKKSSILPNSRLARKSARTADIAVLSVSFTILLLMFVWYNANFQSPHFKPTSPIAVELFFYLFSSFLIVLSFLGVVYKAITWSQRFRKVLRRSPVINAMANLSFCIYMSHYCVILTNSNRLTHQYSFYFYDVLGFFFTDCF